MATPWWRHWTEGHQKGINISELGSTAGPHEWTYSPGKTLKGRGARTPPRGATNTFQMLEISS